MFVSRRQSRPPVRRWGSYEADSRELPRTGDLWIDGNSRPVCIAGTTNVEILSFDEIREDYARGGGEGDCSLQSWRSMYRKYIELECKRIACDPSVWALLVMEPFCIVCPSRK